MAESLLSMLVVLIKRLIKQHVFDQFVLMALREASKSTSNGWDDQLCEIVADSMGKKCD